MIEQELIRNVVVRIRRNGKQQNFSIDIQVNQSYELELSTFSAILKSLRAAQQNEMIFYFDHVRNHYIKINDEQPFVNYHNLVKENLINVQVEKMLSDEVLANPVVAQSTQRRYKRNREKTIEEAFMLVDQWRKLYREGTFDQNSQPMKVNLDQAAELISTPRKTLEDYYLLFRKGHSSGFRFREHRGSKIGILRAFIKERGKQKEEPKEKEEKEKIDERKFFKLLSPELVDASFMINENEIFDILEGQSSDQDILFEN